MTLCQGRQPRRPGWGFDGVFCQAELMSAANNPEAWNMATQLLASLEHVATTLKRFGLFVFLGGFQVWIPIIRHWAFFLSKLGQFFDGSRLAENPLI